jgi:ribosomal protein S27E
VDIPAGDTVEVDVTYEAESEDKEIKFEVYDNSGEKWGKEKKDTLTIQEPSIWAATLGEGDEAISNLFILVIVLVILMLIIAAYAGSQRRGVKKVREELELAKKEGTIPDFRPPGAALAGTASEKDLLAKGEDEKKKEKEEKKKKSVKVKCPKCDTIQKVTSKKRPLEIECVNCGMKLMLKEKKKDKEE